MKHTVRHRNGKTTVIDNYTRGKAIKLMCSECMGFESHPKDCTDPLCPLFPYRGITMANRVEHTVTLDEEHDYEHDCYCY